MKIKVFNERAIQTFKTNEKHIVISIQEPDYNFVKLPEQKSRLGWIGLRFYDLDEDIAQFTYGKFLFEKKHAIMILKFVNLWKDKIDLILINCVAGISRSMAIGGALGKILNNDDTYFFKQGIPNMRVYRRLLKEYYGEDFNDFNKIIIPKDIDTNFFKE